MLVYRFLSATFGLALLQQREMKVGRLLELNDPADCQPQLINAPDQRDEEETIAFEKKYLSRLHEDIGILCYSESVEDPVLWSHYADSHRGIAIGYELQPDPRGPIGYEFHRVSYSDTRPVLDYTITEQMRNGRDEAAFINKVVTVGFTTKASSWSYEKEHRRFVYLKGCRMGGTHYFVNAGNFRRIVLGARCGFSVADVRRAARTLSGMPLMISIAQAKLSRQRFLLSFDEHGTVHD